MRKEYIEMQVRLGFLRKRVTDKARVRSMVGSAVENMKVVKMIQLTEQSAILIFRETYESIRQLGDARWWLQGYEPRNHEVSIDALKDMDIKERVKLNHLSRFKQIRNDANYRGFKVSIVQAKEILEFWQECMEEIIVLLSKELNEK